jgi:GT2 family glycosyltransferase
MITVIIPSYFYGHLGAQAIESVLSQTVKPARVIFADDGVGDCSHLADIYPEVEFVFRQKNLGIVDNFQDLLKRSTTPYTLFLGADNYLRPDALEKLSKAGLEYGADIVSYDIAVIGTEKRKFTERVGAREVKDGYNIWRFEGGDITKGNFIHGSSLYNTEKAKAIGYKSSGGDRSEEDWMLFKGMIQNGAKYVHLHEALLYYRRHRENFNPNW